MRKHFITYRELTKLVILHLIKQGIKYTTPLKEFLSSSVYEDLIPEMVNENLIEINKTSRGCLHQLTERGLDVYNSYFGLIPEIFIGLNKIWQAE